MSGQDQLPLPALLSAALVAFTIESDNEAEHRMPHRTSSHGQVTDSGSGPWLASMVMWWNCMRFVGPDGISVGALTRLARTRTNLPGMQRWGYIAADPDNAQIRGRGRDDLVIRATAAGRAAQQAWQSLAGVVEQRWQDRFGAGQLAALTGALAAVAGQLDPGLPDCMPILRDGLFSRAEDPQGGSPAGQQQQLRSAPAPHRVAATSARHSAGTVSSAAAATAQLPLAALLSRVLLSFAIEFETESDLSLAICANVLRVLPEAGVLVRDLPGLAGVSKESVSMALGRLTKRHLVTLGPAPAGRGKVARLTLDGRRRQNSSGRLVRIIEERWLDRYDAAAIGGLRVALEPLAGDVTAGGSPLFRGLVPYPGNWRAATHQARVLPQFPMVLHRGGYPDGS